MPRASFGGGAADFVYTPTSGRFIRTAAATLTFWSAKTGGTQHTDLLLDGVPVTEITVGPDGQVPEFQGPDGVIKLWADAGGGRVQLDAAISSEDSAVALLVGADGSETKAALSATIAAATNNLVSEAEAEATYARASVVLRPAPMRREAAKVQLTSALGVFSWAGASSVLADTSDFAVGTSAAKFVTDGAGTYATYMWPALSPAWDMTNDEAVRVICKIDSYANVNFIVLDVGTNGGVSTHRFTTALSQQGISTALRIAREGEWLVLDFPKSAFSVDGGTPDWAQVSRFRIGAQDKNGAPLTVRINSVGRIPKQTALPNGAAIFTFDDSSVSHYTLAKAKLDSVGAPGVAYPIADQVGGAGLSFAQLRAMRDISGWEIGTHALSNADHAEGFVGLTEAQVRDKFDALKSWAASNGFNSDTHAWPSAMSDTISERVALQYVSSALGAVTGAQPSSIPNPTRIRRTDLGSGGTLATAQARIDAAKSGGSLAIFVAHQIVPSGATGLQVNQATLDGAIDYCVAQGVPILTMTDALRRLRVI